MVQDEGRFGRVNIPKASWAPLGVRPEVAKQQIRQSFYVYCAVAPKSGEIYSLILPGGDTEMMNIFLNYLSIQFIDNEIIMQTDGAGWHRSSSLVIPKNIHLIFQPPYSPEVNPTEHIWDDVREKELHNKIFDSLEDTMDQVCIGLNRLHDNPDYVKSMTYFPYLNII
jgi:transposase